MWVRKSFMVAVAVFSLIGLVASSVRGQPAGDSRGINVLTRGPVHEAYAETVVLDPGPSEVVPQPPPEAIEEVPPDQRPDGDNVAWIPGYWGWDDEQHNFIWISGVWRSMPPGREWVPGYWSRLDNGYRWVPGYWADVRADEVTYLPEPPESIDEGPNLPAPADDFVWVPGSWVWQHGRYAWRPGYWVRGQRDWMWVPSHYVWSPRGYVYSDGYWDYDLERRGVLFAPVYFEPDVYRRRGFVYSPAVVIDPLSFVVHLFLRPRDCHYYFGDYYDPTYRREGYIYFHDVGNYRSAYDPVFVHERFVHRGDRDWDRRIERDYDDRRDHADRRPPRTFDALRSLASNRGGSPDRNVAIATALSQFTQRNSEKIQFHKVAENDRKVIAQKGQDILKIMGERRQQESSSSAKPIAVGGQPAQPTAVKRARSAIAWTQGKSNAPAPPAVQQAPQPDTKVQPTPRKPGIMNEELRKGASPNDPAKGQSQPIKPIPSMPEPKSPPQPVKPIPSKPEPKSPPQPVKPIPSKPEPKSPPQPIKPIPSKPEPKQEAKPQPKPEPKPEPKQAPRPEPKPEPKPVPKPEPKPAPRPEPKPEPKPVPRPEPKPEPKPVPKPEPKPSPRPEPPEKPEKPEKP